WARVPVNEGSADRTVPLVSLRVSNSRSVKSRQAQSKELGAMMIIKRAKAIYANLGLATIARNKLKTSNPDVVCELVKAPAGVEIVRGGTPVEATIAVPEVESEAKP